MSEQTANIDRIVRMIAESAQNSEDITVEIAEVAATVQDSSTRVDQVKIESSRSSFTDQLRIVTEIRSPNVSWRGVFDDAISRQLKGDCAVGASVRKASP